ncbi:MAG: TIM barrel protein [Clostridia bacterium]|nr:TIM barrel protein [Clostridia bacterium]
MNHNLGLVSVSFRNHTPKEILNAMKQCGLSYIEWGSDVHAPPENAAEIAALQREYNVVCCSYGTYFRLGVTPTEELQTYIAAAKTLGTDILRLWCGDKNSENYTVEQKTALFAACDAAAKLAEKNGVTLCMECHNNTYTNAKEASYELMQAVGSPAFRMYWQPNQYRSDEENIAYAKLLSPYTVNLHVFNWKGKEKYPLQEATQLWKDYLACFPGKKTLLLEFMPDGKLESLAREVQALKEIAE